MTKNILEFVFRNIPGWKTESIRLDFFLLSAQEYSIPYQSWLKNDNKLFTHNQYVEHNMINTDFLKKIYLSMKQIVLITNCIQKSLPAIGISVWKKYPV